MPALQVTNTSSGVIQEHSYLPGSSAAPASLDLHWYAVQTVARHEKAVSSQVYARGVEVYLPLYSTVHQWGKRRAKVELPLFPGYLFVHISNQDRVTVLTMPGTLRIVSFNGVYAPVPDAEIIGLRNVLRSHKAEPYRELITGQKVLIKAGPLQGLEGTILRRNNGIRFIVSIASIQQAVSIEASAEDLQCLN